MNENRLPTEPFKPTETDSSPQVTHGSSFVTPKKSKKWKWISIIMGFLTVMPIIIFALAAWWLSRQAEQGVSGTEFMILIFVPFLFLVPIFVVADIVLAFIYLFKVRSGVKKKIFPFAIILLGVIFLGYLSWNVFYQVSGGFNEDYIKSNTLTRDEAVAKINNCEVEHIDKGFENDPPELVQKKRTDDKWWYIQPQDLDYIDNAARNAPEACGKVASSKVHDLQYSSQSIAEATDLLNSCSVIGFYYPGSSAEEEFQDILPQTGIVLVSDGDGDPIRIHVNEPLLAQMAPVATNATNTCPDLQIWNGRKLFER